MQVLASQQALAQVNSRSPAGTPPAPSRVLYPRSTTTTLCPPGAGQACTLCHAGPSLSVRATDAEGEVAVLNSNPAGSLSWHQQMTSPDEGSAATGPDHQGWQPSQGWRALPHHLHADELWAKIRNEARRDAEQEPALASFMHSSILAHSSLSRSMSVLLANKLASQTIPGTQLMRLIAEAYEDDPDIMAAGIADLQAVYERDAACERYTQCILYFKGFQALQGYRISHWLWKRGRKALAMVLQSRIAEAMQVDIHPAARLGRGVMIDHATGVVIGETAIVGDNVSMLHHVTLGGSGTGRGIRHPHIDHGVLLGAGVCVLGPILVGAGSKVGAGSVVVTDLPCHCVAVGVPARIIKQNCPREPTMDMDHVGDFVFDYVI